MTLWQFGDLVDGWVRANSDPSKEGLNQAEENSLWALASVDHGN